MSFQLDPGVGLQLRNRDFKIEKGSGSSWDEKVLIDQDGNIRISGNMGIGHDPGESAKVQIRSSSSGAYVNLYESDSSLLRLVGASDDGSGTMQTTNVLQFGSARGLGISNNQYDFGFLISTGVNGRDFWLKATSGKMRFNTDYIALEPVSSDPPSPVIGQIWFRTDL